MANISSLRLPPTRTWWGSLESMASAVVRFSRRHKWALFSMLASSALMSLLLLAYLYVRRHKSKLRLQLFQQRRNEGDSFFDVCVVGAGPAGATCAWHLGTSRSGLKVLLLDKAHLPRDKICGDVLSPQVQRQLWLMQILQDIIAEGSGRWVRRPSEPLATAAAACSQWMLTEVARTHRYRRQAS